MARTTPDQPPFLTVVVPVRNGESQIAACLDAVLATDYPPDRREVIAVDNGSTDGTAAEIRSRPVRYLREPCPGVSNARNAGIAASSGEILAFTDADCLPEPQWLAEIATAFADPSVGCVAGDLQHAPPHTAAERQSERMLGNWQRFAFGSRPPYAITANASFRREVFDQIGPFDTRLVRAQDVEMGARFDRLSPLRIAFAERATVRHRNRATQLGFFRQQLGWAYGAGLVGAKLRASGAEPAGPPRMRDLRPAVKGLGLVALARLRGRGERAWLEDAWFDLLRQFAWVLGCRAGLIRGARIWRGTAA